MRVMQPTLLLVLLLYVSSLGVHVKGDDTGGGTGKTGDTGETLKALETMAVEAAHFASHLSFSASSADAVAKGAEEAYGKAKALEGSDTDGGKAKEAARAYAADTKINAQRARALAEEAWAEADNAREAWVRAISREETNKEHVSVGEEEHVAAEAAAPGETPVSQSGDGSLLPDGNTAKQKEEKKVSDDRTAETSEQVKNVNSNTNPLTEVLLPLGGGERTTSDETSSSVKAAVINPTGATPSGETEKTDSGHDITQKSVASSNEEEGGERVPVKSTSPGDPDILQRQAQEFHKKSGTKVQSDSQEVSGSDPNAKPRTRVTSDETPEPVKPAVITTAVEAQSHVRPPAPGKSQTVPGDNHNPDAPPVAKPPTAAPNVVSPSGTAGNTKTPIKEEPKTVSVTNPKEVKGKGTDKNTVAPKVSVTVPPVPDVNKTTTVSATAISS
eukprot:Tbor_TRINITY_DN6137_c1_g1::TRINITY_DN6137_c1_g1_i4::g.21974::m.21974